MRKTGKINKIKRILLTIQKVLGKIASFGERIHYIFSWTDRIVTGVALFVASLSRGFGMPQQPGSSCWVLCASLISSARGSA